MIFALTLVTVDALLIAAAFAYIWLTLIPAWLGRVARQEIDQNQEPVIATQRGSVAIETLRQRRFPAHRRHAVVFFNARSAQ